MVTLVVVVVDEGVDLLSEATGRKYFCREVDAHQFIQDKIGGKRTSMVHLSSSSDISGSRRQFPLRKPPLPLFAIQPILRRIINKIAKDNMDMFGRLGPHYKANFVIDPVNLPFVLLLRPDPDDLLLVACRRNKTPPHDAKISGNFLDLLMLVDGDLDGDALFFARELTITGNTEAVVCLRNALDDIDSSIAASVADMFGPPGRVALNSLRRISQRKASAQGNHK